MKIKIMLLLSTLIFSFNLCGNSKEILQDGAKTHFKFMSDKSEKESPEQILKIDETLKINHAVFAGITYASLLALDGIGAAVLYYAFTDPNALSYSPLKYSHIAVAASALLSFATFLILGFTKLGLKVKNKLPIKMTHVSAAIVTLSFYVLELATIVLSSVFFATPNLKENAKWVGLAHGITCGATTMAFSVSLITIFL